MTKTIDGDRMLYQCDPELHTECTKTGCYLNGGPCELTFHAEFRVAGTEGIPESEMLGEVIEDEPAEIINR